MNDLSTRLITADKLTRDHLIKVATGEVFAIQIHNFYKLEYCETLAPIIKEIITGNKISIGEGIYDANISSFWNARLGGEQMEKYFANSIPMMHRIRNLVPFKVPSDLLRLELDELWPAGAHLMHLNDKTMHFGIARLWSGGAEPHEDFLLAEIPNVSEVQGELSQMGANIYLKASEEGGELTIWNKSFTPEESLELGVVGNYDYPDELLGNEYIVVKPQEGDLIIINTLKVHAVNPNRKGERITISGFIGFWGIHEPLRYWS